MDIVTSTLSGVWPVLVFGILLGAGLPAIFALGLKAGSPTSTASSDGTTAALTPVGTGRKVLAGLCFGIVALAVVTGIVFLIATGHR